MDKNGLVYTIIFCFIITFAFVFLLALTQTTTENFVEVNQQLASYRAILNALGVDYDPSDREETISKYNEVEELMAMGQTYYRTEVNNETVYGLRTAGPGLWGRIEVVLGFDSNLGRYTGLEIIEQNETPGLGGRIADDWFKEQFRGQAIPASIMGGGMIGMAPTGTDGASNRDDAMIDAITGASRTSESIQFIVSDAVRQMSAILEMSASEAGNGSAGESATDSEAGNGSAGESATDSEAGTDNGAGSSNGANNQ